MSIAVRYFGVFTDHTGYGTATRTDIVGLFLSQVQLTTQKLVQVLDRASFGWEGAVCEALENQTIDYQVKIFHVTPDLYPKYMEKGKFQIGRLMWETDKLPKEWVNPLNQMNEVWTATEPQAQMIRESGVTTPIKCFPQPINTIHADSVIPPFKIPNFEGTVFYSIFQFIDRKNPRALLETYWKTFEGIDNVCLVIKTFKNGYSDKEFAFIKAEITKWKTQLGLKSYPRVYLTTKLLNSQEMFRLHKAGDVFVSASCGEGWGIPAVEASLMGRPVISIDKTGFADLFPKEIFYPIECELVRAIQVPTIPWYRSDQKWLAIDKRQLAQQMLDCYNNTNEVKQRGQKASAWVKENLNYFVIGAQMRQRLLEIEKFL